MPVASGWKRNLLALGMGLLAAVLLVGPAESGVLDASWVAPTTNTDGSPLTDLASYRVYYGPATGSCPGSNFFPVASPTPSPGPNTTVSFRLTGLVTGTLYYVSVGAVDLSGNASACSLTASGVAQVDFAVSPTSAVNFGNVNIGSFANQVFIVQSTRAGTVSGSASASGPFSIVSGSPFTLGGLGATQAVTVRFTPTASATVSTNVTFTADGDTISRLATGTGTGTGPDTTPPTITITSPTSNPAFTASSSPLILGGTASDNVGVTQVTWASSRGGSGTATGTTSWTTSGIVLQTGSNVLTVTARDAAGNIATRTLTVAFNDTTAPTVTITSPTSSPTFATSSSIMTLGGTASDNVGVTQVTWANSRGGSGTATGTTSWTISGIVLQTGSNVLTVTARDAAGNTATGTSTVTLTTMATFTFTDNPLTARSTLIKRVHFTELRGAIDSKRASRGLAPFAWTDPTLTAGSTRVRLVHLTELRTALNQAYQAAGRTSPTYTDASPVAGATAIKAIHLNELRAALNAL